MILFALFTAFLTVPALGQKKDLKEVVITRCWSDPVVGGIDVAYRDAVIYVAREGGIIEAISPAGARIWSTELGGNVVSNVEPKFASVLVVTAVADGKAAQLRSLSTETGVVKWSAALRPSDKYSILYFDITAVVTAEDGGYQSFHAATGEPVVTRTVAQNETVGGDELGNIIRTVDGKQTWKYRTGGSITHTIEFPDAVLAASNDNFVYMISRSDGDVRWKHRLSGRVAAMRTLGTGHAVVSGADDHGFEIIELRKGRAVGRIAWPGEENVTDVEPLDDQGFLVLTRSALDRYTIGTCPK